MGTIRYILPEGREIEIYTDGSGIEGKVGLAFVVLFYDAEIDRLELRLSDGSSVFQAELLATKKAIEWARERCEGRAVHIYSDAL